jgi:DUF971 family protein
MSPPWPTDLCYHRSDRRLEISWDDGTHSSLSAELLRVESPSAEVKGHGPGQKQTVPGKRLVSIERMEPVGNYAVRIVFSDGHNSGLYSWALLHELAQDQDRVWARYLNALAEKGLNRD